MIAVDLTTPCEPTVADVASDRDYTDEESEFADALAKIHKATDPLRRAMRQYKAAVLVALHRRKAVDFDVESDLSTVLRREGWSEFELSELDSILSSLDSVVLP